MRLAWLGLILLLPAPLSHARDDRGSASRVVERLQQVQQVSGRFEQARWEEGLPQPLHSSGSFLFWRPAGVSWSTEQPLQQTIIYRNDKTLLRESEAVPPIELSGRAERYFRRVLLDVFSLDEAQLAVRFDSQWTLDGQGGWQLVLQPVARAMQRAISQVRLSGTGQIESLEILFAKGSTLSMHFFDHETGGQMSTGMCEWHFAYTSADCARALAGSAP